jgi:polysaccharide deacetylase 2 family uncharacterized protein YibQ
MKPDQTPKGQRGIPSSATLYLIFALLAFFSSLGLDYQAWKKGEKSYLFSVFSPRKVEAVRPAALTDLVLGFLEQNGIPAEAVQVGKDKAGTPQVNVSLSPDAYTGLESRLEDELKDKKALVQKKEKEAEDKVIYSWLVRGERRERLTLLFACPRLLPEKKEEIRPYVAVNKVAIIIDDMGSSLEAVQEICDLKKPVTISILPLSPYAVETAQMAQENGLEVMLHLPGESLNYQEGIDDDNGMIRSGMSEKEIRAIVEDDLSKLPYVKGVNNHMGSKITQEEAAMRPILEVLKEKDLYFLDSRTTSHTIAFDLARKMGLRSGYRNIFLDSPIGADFTKQKIIDLCRLAQRTGKAICIGHPFPETLGALKENIHLLDKYKVKPVFVSQIVER